MPDTTHVPDQPNGSYRVTDGERRRRGWLLLLALAAVVVLLTTDSGSDVTIRPGQLVTSTGRVVTNDTGSVSGLRLGDRRDERELARQAAHVALDAGGTTTTTDRPRGTVVAGVPPAAHGRGRLLSSQHVGSRRRSGVLVLDDGPSAGRAAVAAPETPVGR